MAAAGWRAGGLRRLIATEWQEVVQEWFQPHSSQHQRWSAVLSGISGSLLQRIVLPADGNNSLPAAQLCLGIPQGCRCVPPFNGFNH